MIERAVAHIDLGAVERNAARIREQLNDGTRLCAVVKANAYGHGDTWCAKAALARGAEWLAVAAAGEAVELRRHGIDAPLLIMGALTGEEARMALEAPADIVAWEPEFVLALARAADAAGVIGRVHVKLDSGMGRLGTRDAEQALAVARIVHEAEHLQLVGLMTHFATADEQGDEYFPQQLESFTAFAERLRAQYPDVIVHAANSPATFREPASHFDMVRCGVALYGLDPFQEDPALRGLEPALTLSSWVAAVRRFEPGDSAGYGRAWSAAEATWIGTIPIGYGDGWRRDLTNNADVLIGGRRYPLVGRVSMDNITVDLGPETQVRPGTPAVLIGRDGDDRITAEEIAKRLGTINYEVTCGLAPRVRRHWSAA
ncbi:MAG TPA: alanine racemase [Thermoleophilaceae bacterium]|nr:alanine racemase [Thermoleophilaceae bacterium]